MKESIKCMEDFGKLEQCEAKAKDLVTFEDGMMNDE